jgi:hypothetical protein
MVPDSRSAITHNMVVGTELGNGLGEIVADCALGGSQLGGDLGVRTAVARSLGRDSIRCNTLNVNRLMDNSATGCILPEWNRSYTQL